MADVKQCDRCGVHYKEGNRHFVETFGEWRAKEYDLCRDCCNELEEFLRGAKPKNLLERIVRMIQIA